MIIRLENTPLLLVMPDLSTLLRLEISAGHPPLPETIVITLLLLLSAVANTKTTDVGRLLPPSNETDIRLRLRFQPTTGDDILLLFPLLLLKLRTVHTVDHPSHSLYRMIVMTGVQANVTLLWDTILLRLLGADLVLPQDLVRTSTGLHLGEFSFVHAGNAY